MGMYTQLATNERILCKHLIRMHSVVQKICRKEVTEKSSPRSLLVVATANTELI